MTKLAGKVSDKDHTQGSAEAPVTLVEYGDYQCPSCGDAAPIVKKLQKHFGAKLRFVFRNFPLPMHEFAEPAAEAAEFAGSQGKFWEMHDALYKNQDGLNSELLPELGEELGLSGEELSVAVERKAFHARIQADMESGEKSGLRGTPAFYLNGSQHNDSYDYEALKAAIQAAL